jgi:hypothetical protein
MRKKRENDFSIIELSLPDLYDSIKPPKPKVTQLNINFNKFDKKEDYLLSL